MKHILGVMKQTGIHCLACEPVNLDVERFAEYRDGDEHPVAELFETPKPSTHTVKVAQLDSSIPPILHYFLDGSRRTYRVGDVILNGRRYLPLVAGQIGVAVVARRSDGTGVSPVRSLCTLKNVLAFPATMPDDDLDRLRQEFQSAKVPPFELLKYEVKADRDPVDLAVARIMSGMHDCEVEAVKKMTEQHLLGGSDRYLVIDGPLRFKETASRKFDVVQFRNVIGLSKTFRPSFTVGGQKSRKNQDVGAITASLNFSERTPVFRTEEENKQIGVWYLRLRPAQKMAHPMQGIVKLECFATDPDEQEKGFDSERIDIISAHILRERNVTPYQTDSRWASHIYPIHLAETYLKRSFISDLGFRALF
jgi:hypothetical protein